MRYDCIWQCNMLCNDIWHGKTWKDMTWYDVMHDMMYHMIWYSIWYDTIYYTFWHDMVLCGVMLCDVMWRSVAWCGVVWCDVVWCEVMCDLIWCDVIRCDVMFYVIYDIMALCHPQLHSPSRQCFMRTFRTRNFFTFMYCVKYIHILRHWLQHI